MVPIIYNLFPLLVGSADRWSEHAERAAAMGFNWLYVNPIHYPGFSGSLYAVKDYARLHPAFVPRRAPDDSVERIVPVLDRIREAGLSPIVDLVINHTAKDSPLVQQHPNWYLRDAQGNVQSPYAVDPDDPANVTVWGDLAEIDNEHAQDRQGLWEHWARLVERYVELGFEGFRCDAAYKVPAELWAFLVHTAERARPNTIFFAETLGCTIEEARALKDSGLHFFFNSSRWWDFEAPWLLDQHREFRDIPSISFPESHDTERLAAESGGSEAVQRQRYAFAALYSAGVMMPVGYEFGFRKKLNVVSTSPDDWEQPAFDLTAFVTRMNRLKREKPLWHGEGEIEALDLDVSDLLVLQRTSDQAPGEVGLIIVNKQVAEQRTLPLGALELTPEARLDRPFQDDEPQPVQDPQATIILSPAEVVLLTLASDHRKSEIRNRLTTDH